MRNQEQWIPSKYVYHHGRLIASRDTEEVSIGDRLLGDRIAGFYERYLPEYVMGRLIDLGCGRVPLYATYREYVDEVICVDWGNTSHQTSHLDYECDLTQALPFVDGEFNTIILSDVLEHIPEPEALWWEMSRILAPGGVILLNVPFFYRLHEEPYDYYRYTEHALRRFAERAGFDVILLEPAGGTPEIFADLFGRHLRFVPIIGNTLVAAIQRLTSALVATAWGQRLSASTGRMFPLGYFLIARKATSPSLSG